VRRVGAIAALVVALIASISAPSFAGRDDELKNQQQDLGRDLKSATSYLHESSAELISATKALARSRAQLVDARTQLNETRVQLDVAIELDLQAARELDEAEGRLLVAEEAVADSQQEVFEAREALAAFVVNSYQYGNPSLMSLGVVLDGGSTTDFSERLSLAESVAGAQVSTVDELRAATTLLEIREQQVAEVRNEVAARRAEAAENLQRKELLEATALAEANAVISLVQERQAAHARATKAKRADLRHIAELEQERARIELMLQRIALRQSTGNLTIDDQSGWLSVPLADPYITSPFGMRMHPILKVVKLHDGTDFSAACGSPIYAAAPGVVVSEYVDGGYGDRIIISHGNVNGVSLATSYNHLSRFVVSDGQRVKRGQLIALAGTTGYSTGCHLHFMVYENGVAVNPLTWL